MASLFSVVSSDLSSSVLQENAAIEIKAAKNKILIVIFLSLVLSGCVGVSSKGIFGTGVSVALDPRTVGTQIDDSIMQKNLVAKMIIRDKKHLISVKTKVLDGRIFLTGKVDNPEEKLQLTKLSWEIKGVRSVRNDIKIKEKFNFKSSAKDILITSQLRTAMILNKNIKASNYQIDTYKKKIYIYGIALTSDEKDLVISEAKEILDVKDVVASILLVEDLRIQKD